MRCRGSIYDRLVTDAMPSRVIVLEVNVDGRRTKAEALFVVATIEAQVTSVLLRRKERMCLILTRIRR